MNRKVILIIVIPLVLACLCIGGLAALGTITSGQRDNTRATQTTTANDLIDPLRALCTGQSGGVARAANYTAGPGIHPMIAFRALGAASYNRDTRVGTGDWAAKSLADAQLVACEEDTSITIESCPYKSETTGATSTINRMQNQVKIRLIAARTGQVVASQTLQGARPRECQDKESFPSGTSTLTLSGEPVAATDIQAWLRAYVAP